MPELNVLPPTSCVDSSFIFFFFVNSKNIVTNIYMYDYIY